MKKVPRPKPEDLEIEIKDAVSAGRPAARASAGRPDARLDGPVPAAADRVSAGDSAGRPVGRLDRLAGRLDLDCWTSETSPDRGMAPQIDNEPGACWFRKSRRELRARF